MFEEFGKKLDIHFENDAYELYELNITDSPVFKLISDCYVITMHNSLRHTNIVNQLKNAKLTKKAKILVNYGFKTGKKPDVDSTTADLFHANKIICQMESSNPLPIGILEDDCEFVANEQKLANVENIMMSGISDGLSLGSLVLFGYPGPMKSIKVVCGGLTHCMFYNTKARCLIQNMPLNRDAHDTILYWKANMLTTRMPMAVQKHPRTELSLIHL